MSFAVKNESGCDLLNKKTEIEKKQTNIIWFLGLSIFFFIIYFLMNNKTAYLNDDYTYRLVFEYWRISENPLKVSSLADIYSGMINHYMVWGGRIPVHTMIQLLLWLVDKKIFNIINSLMVVLLGILMYFHVNFGKKRNLFLYVLIFTMIWFFMPQPELTMLNLTNSVNNMWTCIYVLIILIPYRILLISDKEIRHKIISAICITPLCFLAGWSSEPSGAAAGTMAVLVIVYLLKNRKRPPLWAYTGVVSLAAGWVFMTFAPGYRVKADKYYGVHNVLKNAVVNFDKIEGTLISTTFKSLWVLILFVLISATILYTIRKRQYINTRLKKSVVRKKIFAGFAFIPEALYIISAFVSVFIYIIAPEFLPRYLFPAATFLIISTGILNTKIFDEVDCKEKTAGLVIVLLISLCLISTATDAVYEYDIVSYNYELTTTIEKDIKSQVEQEKKDIVIKGKYRFLSTGRYNIYQYSRFGYEVYWGGLDPEYEMNRMFAANFGADTYINQADMSFIKSK